MKMRYSLILLPILAMALLLSAGCGAKETVQVDPDAVKKELLGKIWIAESLFGREVRGDAQLTLEFLPDGTVKGSGGCNEFSGQYTLGGKDLTFGPLVSTKKACSPAADEQEFTFMAFLATITSVQVDGNDLELYGKDTPNPMIFSTGGSLLW